jgi:hypothetical protein
MTASPSATRPSKAMETATSTKASGTTWGIPENTSQIMKLRLSSVIHVARSRGTTTWNTSKSFINNAPYTRSRGTRSSSASPFANQSMHNPSLKLESEKTRRITKEVKSQGLKTFRIRRTSSTSSLAETADSPPSAQKLTLREILSVEPATTKPLRYSEVLISFSRDDQWTSFSKLGKFSLVLDPIVAGSQLTRVLIDGGSGLNLLFASTLKKMGLYISKMLTPNKTPFYSIVPGNAATPLGSVALPVTFGMKDNYRTEYIKFEVPDFNSSYHAILGKPALAKFMAVPHYVHLLLNTPDKIGVLTLRGDLKSRTTVTRRRSSMP